jgi:hypothetical protein
LAAGAALTAGDWAETSGTQISNTSKLKNVINLEEEW